MGDGLTVHGIDEYSTVSRMEESSRARQLERTGTEWEGRRESGSVLEVRRARGTL